MRAKIYTLMLTALSFSMTSCFDDTDDITQENINTIEAFLTENDLLENAVKTSSGSYVVTVEEGSSKNAESNLVLETDYYAYIFDPNAENGEGQYLGISQGFKFIPDSSIFSLGFSEGVQEMTEGQRAEFYIPSGIPAGASPGFSTDVLIPSGAIFKYDTRLKAIRTLAEQNAMEDELIEESLDSLARDVLTEIGELPEPFVIEDLIERLDSGVVKVRILSRGDTTSVTTDSQVNADYQGFFLENGDMFDEAFDTTFELDTTSFVFGFSQGLLNMKQGERALIFIPSRAGYGATGSSDGTIPPFEPIYFDVYVREVTE
ncbi:FKBP-type peptidyl-prolyl cis-trans isomerase [Sediminitomix flava]|uniref:Peptidyl-prolyl cis-trans isomerase n=1 Tax=Sediminitomix flava TaxID=379075 RepID=A0A315ZUB5_SEDFL|nr:FKBP-type peptidyl-prolyl cis-trans isomerase [Sediminitomix flava]PWJ39229.1 FKBP-type peptidyl-prolyl cis-trans isomerase [Sediminitomix flava]